MKCTAKAPANIAFLKYWGKSDDLLRLPANSSFSMNLSEAFTLTTVECSDSLNRDVIEFEGETVSEKETHRVIGFLGAIRSRSGIRSFSHVRTKNSFPKGTGIASSASGFAALTLAATSAMGLALSEKELSILARLGSGSACRSIPDGFVMWEKGTTSETSFAHSIAQPTFWDLRDILCIVDSCMKKISTTDGHAGVKTSPLWEERMTHLAQVESAMLHAFTEKNFSLFGQIVEDECMNMHAVMQSQSPPLYYWNETTTMLMDKIHGWRTEGIEVYYTIDAGANVHVLCESKNLSQVMHLLQGLSGILKMVINAPSKGAHVVNEHLF